MAGMTLNERMQVMVRYHLKRAPISNYNPLMGQVQYAVFVFKSNKPTLVSVPMQKASQVFRAPSSVGVPESLEYSLLEAPVMPILQDIIVFMSGDNETTTRPLQYMSLEGNQVAMIAVRRSKEEDWVILHRAASE